MIPAMRSDAQPVCSASARLRNPRAPSRSASCRAFFPADQGSINLRGAHAALGPAPDRAVRDVVPGAHAHAAFDRTDWNRRVRKTKRIANGAAEFRARSPRNRCRGAQPGSR